jgi:hypothetical protein
MAFAALIATVAPAIRAFVAPMVAALAYAIVTIEASVTFRAESAANTAMTAAFAHIFITLAT